MEKSLTELLAPNFLNFLRRHGKIRFVDEIPGDLLSIMAEHGKEVTPKRPIYIDGETYAQLGKRHIILLDREFLGFFDNYEDPGALEYHGEDPRSGEKIRLIYIEEPNPLGEIGRIDLWKDIPFP